MSKPLQEYRASIGCAFLFDVEPAWINTHIDRSLFTPRCFRSHSLMGMLALTFTHSPVGPYSELMVFVPVRNQKGRSGLVPLWVAASLPTSPLWQCSTEAATISSKRTGRKLSWHVELAQQGSIILGVPARGWYKGLRQKARFYHSIPPALHMMESQVQTTLKVALPPRRKGLDCKCIQSIQMKEKELGELCARPLAATTIKDLRVHSLQQHIYP